MSVNCIHPGVVGTDIIVSRESSRGSFLGASAEAVVYLTGAKRTAYCATGDSQRDGQNIRVLFFAGNAKALVASFVR